MTSTWFSRSQPSTSVSDRPRRSSAATFAQSPGWRAAFSRFSPGRFQEAQMPTSSKTCRNRPTPGAGSPAASPAPRSATGPGGPAPPPSRSRPAGGRPSADSAPAGSRRPRCQRPRRPVAIGQHPALVLQVVGIGVAGPRFWRDGVMLRWAEFWLCWLASPFGNASQSDGPGPRAV